MDPEVDIEDVGEVAVVELLDFGSGGNGGSVTGGGRGNAGVVTNKEVIFASVAGLFASGVCSVLTSTVVEQLLVTVVDWVAVVVSSSTYM